MSTKTKKTKTKAAPTKAAKKAAKKVAVKKPKTTKVEKPKAPKTPKAEKPKKERAARTSTHRVKFDEEPKKKLRELEITKDAHDMLATFADGSGLATAEALDRLIRVGVNRLAALHKYTVKPTSPKPSAPAPVASDDEDDD